jgi:hypothetical protein
MITVAVVVAVVVFVRFQTPKESETKIRNTWLIEIVTPWSWFDFSHITLVWIERFCDGGAVTRQIHLSADLCADSAKREKLRLPDCSRGTELHQDSYHYEGLWLIFSKSHMFPEHFDTVLFRISRKMQEIEFGNTVSNWESAQGTCVSRVMVVILAWQLPML